VLIDTDGTIFSAQPLSGHPFLQVASRNAACGAKFLPTLLSGEPVRVSGIITYNYVP
jgi:protein TonB